MCTSILYFYIQNQELQAKRTFRREYKYEYIWIVRVFACVFVLYNSPLRTHIEWNLNEIWYIEIFEIRNQFDMIQIRKNEFSLRSILMYKYMSIMIDTSSNIGYFAG